MELLEVESISKTYGEGDAAVHALRQASFSIMQGEFAAIVGESGSGKSTLLNLIGGLDTQTGGTVRIAGRDIFSMKENKISIFRRRNIGFIFQCFNLIPELTVEQNIIFPILLDHKQPDKAYLEELLDVLNLDTQNTNEVMALLKEASRKYNQTIVMITHSPAIARTADHILEVADGIVTDLGRVRG